MKKVLIFVVVLLGIITQSCFPDISPIIGDPERPFIVNKIVSINSGMSKYFGSLSVGLYNNKPSLVLPSRMFNIGDTIKLCGFKNNKYCNEK